MAPGPQFAALSFSSPAMEIPSLSNLAGLLNGRRIALTYLADGRSGRPLPIWRGN
jgi:hypothetical protein